MKRICQFAFIVWMIGAHHAIAQSPQTRQWTVAGTTREALLYIPTTAKSHATPVIFLFHGHGGNMNEFYNNHSFASLWPDAIVIAPQGLKTPGQLVDRAGNYTGWQQSPGDQHDRDIHFIDELLRSLGSEYKIDTKRIYATGHSNGGSFTYLLWAMRGDQFAAMAPSAAVAFNFNDQLKPKPVIHIMGESDPLVKPAWQKKEIAFLYQLNKCSLPGKPFGASAQLYPSSLNTPLVVYKHSGGHVDPREADADVVKFFKENPRP